MDILVYYDTPDGNGIQKVSNWSRFVDDWSIDILKFKEYEDENGLHYSDGERSFTFFKLASPKTLKLTPVTIVKSYRFEVIE